MDGASPFQEMARLRKELDAKREELLVTKEDFTGRLSDVHRQLQEERDKRLIEAEKARFEFAVSSGGLCRRLCVLFDLFVFFLSRSQNFLPS